MNKKDIGDIILYNINLLVSKNKKPKSNRNLLNKWFQDSIKSYIMEMVAAPLLVDGIEFLNTVDVRSKIEKNIPKDIPIYIGIIIEYYSYIVKFNQQDLFEKNLNKMIYNFTHKIDDSVNLDYNTEKNIRQSFVCFLLLKFFQEYQNNRSQLNYYVSFFELWNASFPEIIQQKKRLSKYDVKIKQKMLKSEQENQYKNESEIFLQSGQQNNIDEISQFKEQNHFGNLLNQKTKSNNIIPNRFPNNKINLNNQAELQQTNCKKDSLSIEENQITILSEFSSKEFCEQRQNSSQQICREKQNSQQQRCKYRQKINFENQLDTSQQNHQTINNFLNQKIKDENQNDQQPSKEFQQKNQIQIKQTQMMQFLQDESSQKSKKQKEDISQYQYQQNYNSKKYQIELQEKSLKIEQIQAYEQQESFYSNNIQNKDIKLETLNQNDQLQLSSHQDTQNIQQPIQSFSKSCIDLSQNSCQYQNKKFQQHQNPELNLQNQYYNNQQNYQFIQKQQCIQPNYYYFQIPYNSNQQYNYYQTDQNSISQIYINNHNQQLKSKNQLFNNYDPTSINQSYAIYYPQNNIIYSSSYKNNQIR